jgi:hypothetical protein
MMPIAEAFGSVNPTASLEESCFLAIPIRIGPIVNEVSSKERLRSLSKESAVRPMEIIAKQIMLREMSKASRPLRET